MVPATPFKAIGELLGGVPSWIYIALAIGAAALWIDHRGYQRAVDDNKQRQLERIIDNGKVALEIDRALKTGLADLDRQTADKFNTIKEVERTIVQPIIERELTRDPALAARECLTPELLRAVNISRGYPGGTGQADDQRADPRRLSGATGDR